MYKKIVSIGVLFVMAFSVAACATPSCAVPVQPKIILQKPDLPAYDIPLLGVSSVLIAEDIPDPAEMQEGSDNIEYNDMICTGDNNLIAVGGYSYKYASDPSYYYRNGAVITKYDRAGKKIWQKFFRHEPLQPVSLINSLRFNSLIEVTDGYIVNASCGILTVLADESTDYMPGALLIKLDPEGGLVWAKTPGFSPIIPVESGFLALGGENIDEDNPYFFESLFMAQFDTDGNTVARKTVEHHEIYLSNIRTWTDVGTPVEGYGYDHALGNIKIFNAQDGFFVLGHAPNTIPLPNWGRYITVIAYYGLDGNFQWQRAANASDIRDVLSVSESGIVVFNRRYTKEATYPCAVKYDFEMNQLWVASYEHYASYSLRQAVEIGGKTFVIGNNQRDPLDSFVLGIDAGGNVFFDSGLQQAGPNRTLYQNIIAVNGNFVIYCKGTPIHENHFLFYNSVSLKCTRKLL